MNRKTILLMSALALAAACEKAKPADKPAPAAPERTDVLYVTPVQHLLRVSMDLRGTRPTIAELEDIEANPDKIASYIDAYMADPRFAERVKEIWNEGYLTRQDKPFFLGAPELRDFVSADEFAKASGNEPLELIAHVVTEDRPFTEVVTANYTMANGVLASYFDITRPDGSGPGWVESTYTDGRPMAGVLSSTDFHTRWRTTDSNKNRGRANAWMRATLCYDFLSRDINVDTALDLSDPNVVNNAVRTNQSCAGCHQTLDPLGSFLYGWYVPEDPPMMDQVVSYPIKTYSLDLEPRWQQNTGRDPGFFGLDAGSRLDGLGKAISEDPRFSLCSVKRFQGALTGKNIADLSFDETDRLNDWFVKENYSAKKLIKEIMLSPEYRIYGPAADSAKDVVGLKLTSPEALDRMLNDLTGFEWKLDFPLGYDLLQNDIYGFREMAGGYDSIYVTAPAYTVNATHILMLRMAAADGAGKVVEQEFTGGNRRLLTKVQVTDTTPAKIEEQAVALNKLLYGMTIDAGGPEAADVNTLWQKAYTRSGDVKYAWKVTLAAMLSDVRIAFY